MGMGHHVVLGAFLAIGGCLGGGGCWFVEVDVWIWADA